MGKITIFAALAISITLMVTLYLVRQAAHYTEQAESVAKALANEYELDDEAYRELLAFARILSERHEDGEIDAEQVKAALAEYLGDNAEQQKEIKAHLDAVQAELQQKAPEVVRGIKTSAAEKKARWWDHFFGQ